MAKHERLHHRRQVDWTNPVTDLDYVAQKIKSAVQSEVSTDVPTAVPTLVSVVYVTASPTFDGPVAGYTTIGVHPQSQSASPPSPSAPAPSPSAAATVNTASIAEKVSSALVGSAVAISSQATSSQPSVTSVLDTILSSSSSSFQVTSTPSTAPVAAESASSQSSGAAASSTSGSDASSISQSSTGMSGGAKAGVAIAVILALVALLVICGFLYRRRKVQKSEEYGMTEDEKRNPFHDNTVTPAPMRHQKPPSLNLRPSSHFQPEMSAATTTSSPMDLEKAQGPVDHQVNPFGQHAELSQTTPQSYQEIPAPLRIKTPSPEAEAGLGLGLAAGAGAITEAAIVAQRHNTPQPLEIKPAVSPALPASMEPAMPSPAGTEFSMNSASPSTMARGPPPTNVHRVQLDFKPSMDDELELRAGQLVRLLHEYDDGWALCIRLDRSAQGVVPRTCLSARPVKPRAKPPGNPPPGMRLPVNPANSRPKSPVGNSGFPPGLRSMSPGPYGGGRPTPSMAPQDHRMRSNSAGNVREIRTSPPGPSPMNPIGHIAAQAIPATLNLPYADNTAPKSPGVNRKPVPGRTM